MKNALTGLQDGNIMLCSLKDKSTVNNQVVDVKLPGNDEEWVMWMWLNGHVLRIGVDGNRAPKNISASWHRGRENLCTLPWNILLEHNKKSFKAYSLNPPSSVGPFVTKECAAWSIFVFMPLWPDSLKSFCIGWKFLDILGGSPSVIRK